jgi:hypothetical protein
MKGRVLEFARFRPRDSKSCAAFSSTRDASEVVVPPVSESFRRGLGLRSPTGFVASSQFESACDGGHMAGFEPNAEGFEFPERTHQIHSEPFRIRPYHVFAGEASQPMTRGLQTCLTIHPLAPR